MATLLKKKFTIHKLSIEPILDRIIILKICLSICNQVFTVIATYAPTNPNVDKKIHLFMRRLLNTRVGRSNKQEHEWHGILRNFETSIRNENGLVLLEFAPLDL